jgi:putative hemolysin
MGHLSLMLNAKVFSYSCTSYAWWQNIVIRAIEIATGQRKIYKLYREYHVENQTKQENFYDSAIRKLNLTVHYDQTKLDAIPKTNPLVVVANHPYGVLDGLVINQLMQRVRPDFKVLTNGVLCRAPEANENLLPIDFSGTSEALQTNLRTRKLAHNFLKQGGCIVVFPAGGVSTIPNWKDKIAQDNEWQPFIGSLIQKSKADVIPLFFEGQNSRLFQLASHVSQVFRSALYFNELTNRIGTQVTIKIGDTMPHHSLESMKDKVALLAYLRKQTYALGGITTTNTPKAWRMDISEQKGS